MSGSRWDHLNLKTLIKKKKGKRDGMGGKSRMGKEIHIEVLKKKKNGLLSRGTQEGGECKINLN